MTPTVMTDLIQAAAWTTIVIVVAVTVLASIMLVNRHDRELKSMEHRAAEPPPQDSERW